MLFPVLTTPKKVSGDELLHMGPSDHDVERIVAPAILFSNDMTIEISPTPTPRHVAFIPRSSTYTK